MEELGTAEAAQVAGVDQSSIRRAIREGRLKGRKVVRDYVVRRRDLEAWMARRGAPAA
jgi:excisionase family DNA binding protein